MAALLLSTHSVRRFLPTVVLGCLVGTWSCAPASEAEPVWEIGDGSNNLVVWKAEIGSDAATPVVSAQRVLVGTNNAIPRDDLVEGDRAVLMSFSRKEGHFQWQTTHGRLSHRANDMPTLGLLGRPFVEGAKLYYQSNRGELLCYDSNDGEKPDAPKLVWKIDFVTDHWVFKRDAGDVGNPLPSPHVAGDLVYCVTGNGSTFGYGGDFGKRPYVPNPDAPSFAAVDKRTGKVMWTSAAPGKAIAYGQWGSPVSAQIDGSTRIFFPGGDGALYAFEALKGNLLGKANCSPPGRRAWGPKERGDSVFFLSQPIIMGQTAYVGLNQDLETPKEVQCPVVAVDLKRLCAGENHAVIWSYSGDSFDGVVGPVAVSEDFVFAMSRSGLLVSLDRASGKEIWRTKLNSTARLGGPVIHGDRLYAPAEQALYVYSLAKEPKLIGRYQFDWPLMGCPVIERTHILVASSRYLWCVRRQD